MNEAIKYSVEYLLTNAARCFLWFHSGGPLEAMFGILLADTR
jgi:hypothetical protein